MDFAEFLRTACSQNTSRRLLLIVSKSFVWYTLDRFGIFNFLLVLLCSVLTSIHFSLLYSLLFCFVLFCVILFFLNLKVQFLTTESLIKNAFYFRLKIIFVLEIFKLLSWLFGFVEKRLDKKVKVKFNIYDVTNWTAITMHILPSVSRSKGNQAMKFGQLIKYNLRNVFLQKSW